MAFTFRNGEHHRNPSGCHNKVRWFLSQCHWDFDTLNDFTSEFLTKEVFDRETPVPRLKDKYKTDWFFGWLDAISIALYICGGEKYKGPLPKYIFTKYPWISYELERKNRFVNDF